MMEVKVEKTATIVLTPEDIKKFDKEVEQLQEDGHIDGNYLLSELYFAI